jgi:hypothetical protein
MRCTRDEVVADLKAKSSAQPANLDMKEAET